MARVYASHEKPTFLGTVGIKDSKPLFSIRGGSTLLNDVERSSTSPLFSLGQNGSECAQDELYVQKRDGSVELLSEEKVRRKFTLELEQLQVGDKEKQLTFTISKDHQTVRKIGIRLESKVSFHSKHYRVYNERCISKHGFL